MNVPGMQWRSRLVQVSAIAIAAAVFVSTQAVAQGGRGGGGGPQMSPEKREAAWALEVKGVGKEIGATGDAEKKLAEAYVASRKSQQEAMEAISGDGNRGPERFQAMQKINAEQREKLKTALAGFLSEDQVKKALPTLGSYSRQWDRLVDTLSGLQLADDKLSKGLTLVAASVVEVEAAREKAMASGDRESIMTAAQEAKAKLDTALADVLSAEQLAQWKQATSFRGGGGGGGGGGGRREGGAAAPPAPAAPPAAPAPAPAEEGKNRKERDK